jgi:hypothetical protein
VASADVTASAAALAARLRGALIRPNDPAYERARRVFNGLIDRRPSLIVRCAAADDVVEAVAFARTSCGSPSAAAGTTSPVTRSATAAWCSTCPG